MSFMSSNLTQEINFHVELSLEDVALTQCCLSQKTADQKTLRIGTDSAVGELNKTIKQRRTFSSGSFQVLNTGNSIKTRYVYIIYNKDGGDKKRLSNPYIQEFPKYQEYDCLTACIERGNS